MDRALRRRLAVLLILLIASPIALASRIKNGGSDEPDGHHSFVLAQGDEAIINDNVYMNDLRAFPGASLDVVFNTCFSGGFVEDAVNEIGADAPAQFRRNFTLSTSANWNEVSICATERTFFGGNLKLVDNFNRAWVDSTRQINTGMANQFVNATNGRILAPAITRDPYASGGARRTATHFETPQYLSPDPAGGPFPNDDRTFTVPDGVQQYAVLAVWGMPEDRHDANLDRVYEMLTEVYDVPAANIVILTGRSNRGDRTRAFSDLSLSDHFIDGPLTLANWRDAIRGRMFTDNNGLTGRTGGTNIPTANDRLFVYNTGHGGNSGRNMVRPRRNGGNLDYTVIESGVFNTTRMDITAGGGDEATSDSDGTSLLQLSTRRPLAPGTTIYIDDQLVGPPTLTVDPSVEIDISSLLNEQTYSYQLRFAHSLLEAATDINVTLADTFDSDLNGDLVAALTFQGGDQMFVGIVPEPVPGCLGLVICWVGRRRLRSPHRRSAHGVGMGAATSFH